MTARPPIHHPDGSITIFAADGDLINGCDGFVVPPGRQVLVRCERVGEWVAKLLPVEEEPSNGPH